jgi:hypothetical protein
MDTRIRVIPVDQDPRMAHKTTLYATQARPKQDETSFPFLQAQMYPRTAPKQTPVMHTYLDVLVHGLNRPKILEKVPQEIREMIWEASLRAEGGPSYGSTFIRNCLWGGSDLADPRFLPRLCFLSKSTKDEIAGVFMRSQVFYISSIRDNTFFRKSIASVKDGAKHVRELHFLNFDFFPNNDRVTGERIPTNSDLELAVDCYGLHTVKLTMGRRFLGANWWDNDTQQYVWRPQTVANLVEKYRLRRLLDCKKLRKICWDGKTNGNGSVQVLQDLAEWVEAEFAAKNHHVECVVTWRW